RRSSELLRARHSRVGCMSGRAAPRAARAERTLKELYPRRERPSFPMPEIGREEIRAALLKPFLLRLRDQSGDAAVRTLLATAGLPLRILEDDAGWLSVAGTRRALAALSSALGAQALESSGEWMTHPEVLGAYVRMLRVATTPEDAYRYRAANSSEITRVGTYALVAASPGRAEITYTPRPQLDTDQTDRLLCVARLAEIAAIPRIFGLPEATVDHPACIAR